ncbi:hypothetical protein LCGC14_1663360 [marine sediment metagenome]|uniref:Uncharacterized protein n=1 Tax=marine sediment metagenome TaxID=412755 RepID=A0A0F9HTF7_9ZZZZ
MKFGERMVVVETKVKLIEKQMYVVIAIVLAQMGVQFI